MNEFKALGKSGVGASKELETFPTPSPLVRSVTMTSDEVTALCPITGQPDFYTVSIIYHPKELCIESKSLKLYLQSFREEGLFVEALSAEIAKTVAMAVKPYDVSVQITQVPRGGVEIVAISTWFSGLDDSVDGAFAESLKETPL